MFLCTLKSKYGCNDAGDIVLVTDVFNVTAKREWKTILRTIYNKTFITLIQHYYCYYIYYYGLSCLLALCLHNPRYVLRYAVFFLGFLCLSLNFVFFLSEASWFINGGAFRRLSSNYLVYWLLLFFKKIIFFCFLTSLIILID